MVKRLKFLNSRNAAAGIGAFLIVAVGVVDYANGREMQVVPLYLLPVAIVTWGAGRSWGIIFSALAAGAWLIADLAPGFPHEGAGITCWNATMLLLVFVSVVLILSALHNLVNTLERRVQVRTAQLRGEMARRYRAELAQLRAERLAVVGTMAAQVAHEVRNPLSSISLNIELLGHEITTLGVKSSSSTEEANTVLNQMGQEIDRINKVIRDYLSLARLPEVALRPVPLRAFLEDKLALTKAELAAAHVRLVTDFDPSLELVTLDPDRMWQVILNLVRNAREAMPQGGELKVHTHRQDHEVQICVSDTGHGMANDVVSKLFTPFFSTKAKGTGLGLALSQQIVAEHGGSIECHSVPDIGTTFAISIPVSKPLSSAQFKIQSIQVKSPSYELESVGVG